jgi:hypothetical protein
MVRLIGLCNPPSPFTMFFGIHEATDPHTILITLF